MEGSKDMISGGNVEAEGENHRGSGVVDGIVNFRDVDSDSELGFFLGLPEMSENVAESLVGVGSKRDLGSLVERVADGELNPLDLSTGASRQSGSQGSERLNAFSGGGLHGSLMGGFEAGESSASSAMEDSLYDRVLQIKRAKIDFGLRGCLYGNASSAANSDSQHVAESCNNVPSSHSICKNMIPSLPSSINYAPLLCGGKHDEEERDDSDLIQMDLSDDLLHMVFSFLGHLDLCRAAMVCKQWHTASAHEDFWRSLNFDNCNITASQFEDMCCRHPNITEVNFYGTAGTRVPLY